MGPCVEPDLEQHPGQQALEQVRGWLSLPLDDVTSLVGLSPATYQSWCRDPSIPLRPEEVGSLLRFRTAVGLLVGAIGAERARHALHTEGWLQPLDAVRLAALEARVREHLAPGPLTAPAALGTLTSAQLLAAVAAHTRATDQSRPAP